MKKTIVILSHVTFDNSPYCIFVHEHAKELAKQGYNVVVFAIISWFPLLSHFQKRKKSFMDKMKGNEKIKTIDGIKVIYKKAISFSNLLYNSPINLNGISYYNSIKRLFKKIYKEEEIVLVDAHTFKIEGYVASELKKKYNITTTVTLHGTSFFRNTKTENGKKQIIDVFKNVDYGICVSEKIKKIVENIGIKNTKVIFNGISQHEFKEVEKNKYSILSVGALIPRKKFDIVIETIKELLKKYNDVKLTIVGVGVEKTKLNELVIANNLENNVIFKNQIPNSEVLELMNSSYIFLLPSVAEGFGIVYAEAMKAKCITIGTKGEGIDGFIVNNKNGFLVNPDVNEIVKLITEIYEGKYNIDEITKNAYNSAKNLTWENNAKEYIKIFETKENT